MAGAPLGNQNAKQAKVWSSAIKRALARRSGESVDKGLDALADKLVEAAAEGDQWALREIGDRMEGKAAQTTIVQGDEEGGPVKMQGIIDLVRPG